MTKKSDFYCEFSEEIWKTNYRYKDETSWSDTCKRVAKTIASVEKTKKKKIKYEDLFYDIMYNKYFVPGGRNITNYDTVVDVIEKANINIAEIVSGGALGADKLGELYAKNNNIPLKKFPAKWDLYGKSAGYRRNAEMAEYGDALIAI